MPRRLRLLNLVFAATAVLLLAYVVRESVAPIPEPPARSARATVAPVLPAPVVTRAPGAYGIIADRNLFNPARSDAPAAAVASPVAAVNAPKPSLYGVVLRDGTPIAYIEDPITKRVAAYRVGDTIAGGVLQTIAADRVVLTRPEGAVDLRLRDPSRPRPAPPVPASVPASVPGAPAPQLTPPTPGQVPLVRPGVPYRGPMPPNLLRRVPRAAPPDASSR
jgi:hypothetical protein